MDAPGKVPESINCYSCGALIDLTGLTGFTHVECPQCGVLSVVPVQFGNFLLLNTVGIGGMGTVYKAIDLSLNRYLALKILRRKLASTPEFIENFGREARAAAAVNHPNVAQVYSFGEQDGQYYLAMELLERGSLDDRMARIGKVAEKDVLDMAIQITQGLRAAHQRGLLHRDIKPGNVLFNDDGASKLVDFGIARPPGGETAPPTGQPAEPVWGTPYYIAPEKLYGQAEDVRSDIYSLGATLFHALAGRPPFEARTADEVVVKHATTPAYSLQTYVPTIHPFTAHVIGRMLAKNPAERYSSCDELLRDLQAAQDQFQRAEAERAVVTATGERIPLASIIATAATVVACAVLLVLVWFNRARLFGSEAVNSNRETAPQPLPAPFTSQTNEPNRTGPSQPETGGVDFNGSSPWVKAWNAATLQLAQGRYQDALFGYDTALHDLGYGHGAQKKWIHFYEALALLAWDHPGEARQRLEEKAREPSAQARIPQPQDIKLQNFEDTLVLVLLDEIPAADLENAIPNMPPWAAGLSWLTVGFKHIERSQFARAKNAFRKYQEMEPGETERWAFNLQPLAGRLERDCAKANSILAKIAADERNKDFRAAVDAAQEAARRTKFGALKKSLEKIVARLEAAMAEQEKQLNEETSRAAAESQRNEAEAQQRAETEQHDVETLKTALNRYWGGYDFKEAAAKCAEMKATIKSAAGKQALAQLAANVELLVTFKNQLAADFPKRPYDGANLQTRNFTSLSGRLERATDKQLIFSTPYGELATNWRDLAPITMIKLGEFYAEAFAAQEQANVQARRCLLLAAFSKQYDLGRQAVAYGAKAVHLNPALQSQVESLLGKPAEQ